MANYSIFEMFENPRRGRQARNLTTNVLKSSSEQKFSSQIGENHSLMFLSILEYLCMFSLSFTVSRPAPFPWYSGGGGGGGEKEKRALSPAHYQEKEASLPSGNPNNSPKWYTSAVN